ncbi:ABC transporter permease [Heyndrickxia shackletonii]|uniref:ABC transporter permease n=1 Tax=Heyndrickxia shackletonii TaxID=157838 RepID=A0A0Q3TM67_9BACI|nr:ABC transporter permease [Heyndrickxia shackletonii]KQL54809.1 ABC transporter permease [Heyndrickxia shackletonii]MBB2480447.1 ABC transporter permease [Bacillus sp. APMAM]NEZ01777.1 ABC transporter permease [Heyndrickxia shackletonii]RTZ57447.1 ABC transporter permease [Bacillus sp. SAJ1]
MRQFFINPVLNKEIKLRFRSLKTFLGLLAYLLAIGIIVVGFIYLMTNFSSSGFFRPEESKQMFIMLSFIQLALILFITPGLSAGIISGERERQTLNILLTTTQSSTSIILSKLFSSVSYLLLLIIASLPVYSIVFLFGGVSPGILLSIMGLYIFTILVFASIGVFFSTLIRRTIISIITTYGVTLFFAGGTAFLFLIAVNFSQSQQLTDNVACYVLAMLNPPIVLASMLMPDIKEQIIRLSGVHTSLWISYIVFYSVMIIVLIFVSIRKLRPNMNPKIR